MTRGRGRDRDGDYERERNERNRYDGESGRGRGRRNAEMNGPSRRNKSGGSRSFTNSKFGNYQEEDAFKSTDNVWRNPPEPESWDDACNANTTTATSKPEEWGGEDWAEDWTGDLAESQVYTPSTIPVAPMPLDPITASPPQMQAPVGQPPSSGMPSQGMSTQGMQSHSMDVQPSLAGPPGSIGGGGGEMVQPGGGLGPPPGGLVQQSSMGQPGSVMGQNSTSSNMQPSTTMPDMTRNRIDLAALFGKSMQQPNTTSLTMGVGEQAMPSGRDNSNSVFSQFREPKGPGMNSLPVNDPQGKPGQMGMDQSQGSAQMPTTTRAPTQSKPARKKLPPPSTKIPASAVEMPNSARGLGALDVQFGAMDITMDPAVTDFGLSSSSMPSSSVPISSTLPTSGGLANSAFSVNTSGTSANHLSYSKSSEPPYATSTGISPSGLITSTSSAPSSNIPQPSLDQSQHQSQHQTQQRAPPYVQNTQQKQMTPEPIPLPNQADIKTNTYLSSQKPTSAQSIDNFADKPDKTASQLSQLAGLSSSAGFGLSTSQSLGVNRQVPNSYGSSSNSVTPSSQYQTSELSSGSSAFSSSMGTSGLSGSLSTGPSTIGYSSVPQSTGVTGLSSSSGVHPSASVAGGSLSGSGHLSSGLSASASVTQTSHTTVQTQSLTNSKLTSLDSRPGQSSLSTSSLGSVSTSLSGGVSSAPVTTSTSVSSSLSSSSLGYGTGTTAVTTNAGLVGSKTLSQGSAKLPPNLPPGMPFMYHPNIIGAGFPLVNTIPTHQPMYSYDDFQMQISRLPMPFQQLAATTLNTGRDTNSLGNSPYSATEASKFPRNDAASPVATSLSTQQPQPTAAAQGAHPQTQTQQQTPFLNTTLPPGYPGYGTLPYYAAGPGLMPPGLQYPAVFPAISSLSSFQHQSDQISRNSMLQVQPTNRAQTGTTPHSAFQQSGYAQPGSHSAYGTGYDDLTQTQDFTKGGYSGVSQSQSKGSGVSVSVSSASTGPADLSGSSYSSKSHTQPFDNKGGFHTGTPPPFNYPLTAVTQAGGLNPAAAGAAPAAAYHAAPFVPILPHHSAMLAHQLPGDTQGAGSTGRSQGAGSQSSKASKPSYGTNYWPN